MPFKFSRLIPIRLFLSAPSDICIQNALLLRTWRQIRQIIQGIHEDDNKQVRDVDTRSFTISRLCDADEFRCSICATFCIEDQAISHSVIDTTLSIRRRAVVLEVGSPPVLFHTVGSVETVSEDVLKVLQWLRIAVL